LINFGFETLQCGPCGVRMKMQTSNCQQVNYAVRAILVLLENSFDMDLSGPPRSPDVFSEHIKNLIKLQDYKLAIRLGKSDLSEVYVSEEFQKRKAMMGRDHPRYDKILATMLVSPFPSLPGKSEIEKDYETNRFRHINPDSIGFAYYHIDEFYGKMNVQGLARLVFDIDYVASSCFEYGKWVSGYPKGRYESEKFEPFGMQAKERIKEMLLSTRKIMKLPDLLHSSQAKQLLNSARTGFYQEGHELEVYWERPMN